MSQLSTRSDPRFEQLSAAVPGRWWISDAPDSAVGGILRTDGSVGSLELLGSLVEHGEIDRTFTILGESTNGELLTIPGAWSSTYRTVQNRQEPEDSFDYQTLGFFEVLRGAHFVDGDSQLFDSFNFAGRALTSWINKDLINVDIPSGQPITVSIDLPEQMTIPLPDGDLCLQWLRSWSMGLDVSIQSIPTLTWHPTTPMSWESALKSVVRPIEFFLSLVSGECVTFDEFTVASGDPTIERSRTAHVVAARYSGNDVDVGLRPWKSLIDYESVEDDFPAVLSRWVQLARNHRSAMVQFFSVASAPDSFAEETFLSTVRALEIWHRGAVGGIAMSKGKFKALRDAVRGAVSRSDWTFLSRRLSHANEPSLKERLDSMLENSVEEYSEVVATYHRFSRRVVDTRNVFTHRGTQESRPFTDDEMQFAEVACATLFKLTVLQAVGLGGIAAGRLAFTDDWRWLAAPSNPLVAANRH
ncbi:HEPN domain-containing protein [Ilumatobacter sp.]|uniref:ApeA N-terminal domain 1-containing protein n=1 Tax=Ilumatobacter sp. TaxID=1967498 RepID=UPI0037525EDC